MSKPQFMQMIMTIAVIAGLDVSAAKAENLLDFLTPRPPPAEALVPMETILEAARTAAPGQVVEIELERKWRMWVYEVEVIPQRGGPKMRLIYDAQTGGLISWRKG
ncbi:MAG: hypothetical protein FJX16_11255 [Alphaproteobacteria bacterium]|nr:hypothetical protein [Alphaproteobacteria bacterium]MBM3625873.1 hypothetical protein [Alphaproteobacteria bacterium]MBM3653422.1 hypothetical protein [Alphaproteobacteria bacterium]